MTQAEKNNSLKILQHWAQEDNIPLAVRKETKEGFKGTYTIDYDGDPIRYNLSKSEIYPAYSSLYFFIAALREKHVKV